MLKPAPRYATIIKLTALEPIWILVLTPAILLPGRFIPLTWHPFLIFALLLFRPLRWLIERRWLPATPLGGCLWVILLILPINVWVALDKTRAWQAVGYLALGLAFYIALVDNACIRRKPQLITGFFLLLGLGLALLGPILMAADVVIIGPLAVLQKWLQPVSAQLGETMNPNILAGGLVLMIPMQVALILRRDWTKRRWAQLTIGIFCVGTVGVLLLTLSRGADLAMIVALAVVLLVRWPKLLYASPVMILASAFYLYWRGPTHILELLTFNTKIGGLDGRMEIWSRAYYALQDFMFTGIGIGNFNLVIPQLYPYILIPPGSDIPHAHNLLLQIGVDLGLPGLIAYLGMLINIFVMLISLLRQRTSALPWTLAAGALGSIVAMLVHGLVDATTWGTKLAFMPWLLFSLVTVLYLSAQPSPSKDTLSGS